jgi:hypothetical protein
MQQVAKSTTIVTKIKNLAIGGILLVLALPLAILMPIFPGLRRKFQAMVQFRATDEDLKVLLEMLHAVSIDPSADAINPLLNTHCDRLNETLGQQLYRWSHSTLTQVSPSDAPGIAATIVNFSNRVRTFGGGDRATNLEIARLGYESVLTLYNPTDFSPRMGNGKVQSRPCVPRSRSRQSRGQPQNCNLSL